ncbi:MAG: panthothenate synthetase [Abitibacteriaceae bacterium]|nr:panthothenate synthetase [Abditibacteriaceae bacterium]
MRVLLTVELPVESANAAIKDGSLAKTIQSILDETKPEAAYFLAANGKRSGLIILDLKDPSQIPAVTEPWMLTLNASVALQPVMTPEDLAKAGPAIEQAVKKYG